MNASEFSIRTPALAVLLCSVLSGCLVGPNFEHPQTHTPDVFDRTQTAQASSKAVEAEFNPDWWTLFNDPMLNALQQELTDANLDVAAASARLRESRAGQRIAGAAEYPTLDGAASYNRERGSPNGILSLLGVSPTQSQPQSASRAVRRLAWRRCRVHRVRRRITCISSASMHRGNSISGAARGAVSRRRRR
jgi:outer membrane protein TolC